MSTVNAVIRAFCFAPMPPLLRPDVAQNAAPELDELRAAINGALTELHQLSANIVVIGPRSAIPLGKWLIDQTDLDFDVSSLSLPAHPAKDEIGGGATALTELTGEDTFTVLAMGDGSAARTVKAPGYLDERAVPFDDQVAGALHEADLDLLADLDRDLAAELLVAGRAVWPVCARVAEEQSDDWIGQLLFNDDPYGVSYFVAVWRSGSSGIPRLTD